MIIRPIEPRDRAAWAALQTAFVDQPDYPQTMARVVERVWAWLHDSAHPVEGLAAQDGGALVGYIHFRAYPSTHNTQDIGFIDDLFVVPEARRRGVATALVREVAEVGRARGWRALRWLTRPQDTAARALYDKIAGPTGHSVYGIELCA
jgi:ribosomal protein S18 acetylase RimI-like enzyme